VYLSWTMDPCPRWRVAIEFDVKAGGHDRPGRPEALAIEQELAASGRVRAPRVSFRDGQISVTFWLKAADEMVATASALALLDHAVARVPGLVLEELRGRQARRAAGG